MLCPHETIFGEDTKTKTDPSILFWAGQAHILKDNFGWWRERRKKLGGFKWVLLFSFLSNPKLGRKKEDFFFLDFFVYMLLSAHVEQFSVSCTQNIFFYEEKK